MLCRQRVSAVLLWLGAFIAAGSVPWLSFLEKKSPCVRGVIAASSNITSSRLLTSPGPRKCWVFTHMGKAGGSTVKGLMDASIKHTHHTIGLYQNHQWMRGKDSVKKGLETTKYTMIFGPYAEALRPYGGNNCKWFTMFRHPISRLVSAYFYCKQRTRDELCATDVLSAQKTDLHTFAEHWGNYGLRQFALAFVGAEHVLSAELKRGSKARSLEFPGWYRLKEYFEGLHEAQQAETIAHRREASNDLAMSHLLPPVEDLLRWNYSAVGVLEQWETSMILFNKALEVPNFDWSAASPNIGRKNADEKFRAEEARVLSAAWDDPAIKNFLWLDLTLYDYAVSVHRKQAAEYGVI
ncbi:unnamed protein product [Ectocarpus sp. 12 AP-2014]